MSGKVLDYDWRKMEARYAQLESKPNQAGEAKPGQLEEGGAHTSSPKAKKLDKQDLPVVHTRLKRVPLIFVVELAASIGYGWSIQGCAPLAVPLIMQFIGPYRFEYNFVLDG